MDEEVNISEIMSKHPELFSGAQSEPDPVRGKLLSRKDAARVGGISPETIDTYIEKGYLEEVRGSKNEIYVYYRDLLRASWKSYSEGNTKRMPGK